MERVIKVYDNAFAEYGKDKPEVIAFSADLSGGCEVREFWEKYPDRFYSMGIAEQNMHSFAGGMALEGFVPFVHTFAVFIYRRSLDMVHLSIAHPNVKVRLVGSVPGVTSPAGATHQALDDIAVMRAVPNMTVLECGDIIPSIIIIIIELSPMPFHIIIMGIQAIAGTNVMNFINVPIVQSI